MNATTEKGKDGDHRKKKAKSTTYTGGMVTWQRLKLEKDVADRGGKKPELVSFFTER